MYWRFIINKLNVIFPSLNQKHFFSPLNNFKKRNTGSELGSARLKYDEAPKRRRTLPVNSRQQLNRKPGHVGSVVVYQLTAWQVVVSIHQSIPSGGATNTPNMLAMESRLEDVLEFLLVLNLCALSYLLTENLTEFCEIPGIFCKSQCL